MRVNNPVRDATQEQNWKSYLEWTSKVASEDLSDVASLATGGQQFESVAEYESFLEGEIGERKSKADRYMAEIRSCMSDPCWSENILSSPDNKPKSCEAP